MTQYKTIADLPAASTINPTDLFELSQAGTSRRVTVSQLSVGGGGGGGVAEAPVDGQQYARQSATWTVVVGGTTDWAAITGKPSTFPPTLPIPESGVSGLVSDLAAKAPLASPVFTGDPQAPTPAVADNDTSVATTAYVKAQGYALASSIPATLPPSGAASGDLAGSYPAPTIKASVGLAGVPTAATAAAGTNTTQLATTQFVQAAVAAAAVAIGTTPPASPFDGQLWFNTDGSAGGGVLYIRYNDGNTVQWVPAVPPTSGAPV